MKRIICLALVLMLCMSVLTLGVSAATASAYLTGPGTVRAGDTITLTFGINGTNISGLTGSLSYDSEMLTLTQTKIASGLGSDWMAEFNGNKFVLYDNNQTQPVTGRSAIFTAKFKVNKALETGTRIHVSCVDVVASDGHADIDIDDPSFTAVLAEPLSDNANLASLTVNNGVISPEFKASTTKYTVEVPYEVEALDITAKAADSGAKVTIANTELVPGGVTNVTVKVTAPNGDTKTYTIAAARGEAPPTEPSEPSEPATNPTETPTEPATEPTEQTPAVQTATKGNCVCGWVLAAVVVFGMVIIALNVAILRKLKRNEK